MGVQLWWMWADQLQRLLAQWSRHEVMTRVGMEMDRNGYIGEACKSQGNSSWPWIVMGSEVRETRVSGITGRCLAYVTGMVVGPSGRQETEEDAWKKSQSFSFG